VTLDDKIVVNRLLLKGGASIEEINAVRKHLSLVKGGGLLRLALPRPVVTLILSDVVSDDPSVVGSGPTVPDPSSFDDAWSVLEKYSLIPAVPDSVRRVLQDGKSGRIPETLKPGELTAAGLAVVIGSNRMALRGAAQAAESLGYEPIVDSTPLVGDTVQTARRWSMALERLTREQRKRPQCLIAGGETTVQVRGAGKGGRNQEFALALAEILSEKPVALLSAGSDGIDGPTDAAGAFVDGSTMARARERKLDPGEFLRQNDSYRFFDFLGDLFRCGPTGTNVMDIKIALIG
jgi:glycerate-2-kinase